ncbi:MAG: hypothetical protein LBJ18_00520 [Rickettsiales bacterium]|jgi:hypothetical protein|nr:hypothetical protein [Rickettsiales bacterium]
MEKKEVFTQEQKDLLNQRLSEIRGGMNKMDKKIKQLKIALICVLGAAIAPWVVIGVSEQQEKNAIISEWGAADQEIDGIELLDMDKDDLSKANQEKYDAAEQAQDANVDIYRPRLDEWYKYSKVAKLFSR